jgi:hypothetical protein
MTNDEFLSVIEGERSALLFHQEQLESRDTPDLKWHIQQALHNLGDVEHELKSPNAVSEIVTLAMQLAKIVEDAVAMRGYNIQEIYPK